jgi:hypothetical protein
LPLENANWNAMQHNGVHVSVNMSVQYLDIHQAAGEQMLGEVCRGIFTYLQEQHNDGQQHA